MTRLLPDQARMGSCGPTGPRLSTRSSARAGRLAAVKATSAPAAAKLRMRLNGNMVKTPSSTQPRVSVPLTKWSSPFWCQMASKAPGSPPQAFVSYKSYWRILEAIAPPYLAGGSATYLSQLPGAWGVLAGDGGSIPFGGGGGAKIAPARHAAAGRSTRIWRPTLWGQAPDTIWLVARNLHCVSAPMVSSC